MKHKFFLCVLICYSFYCAINAEKPILKVLASKKLLKKKYCISTLIAYGSHMRHTIQCPHLIDHIYDLSLSSLSHN